jgi:hypothetical protein
MMFCRKLTFLPKTTKTDSEYLSLQDGLPQLDTKTLSLVIIFLSITSVIKQQIVEHMKEMIMYATKTEVLMGSQIETIIYLLHYLITMLYVISETTMGT